MSKHIAIFIVLVFYFPLNNYATDTIPPTGKLINPKDWSIISTNAIRVAAEAEDKESGVKYVRFFVEYRDANRSGPIIKEIGIDSVATYEILWDCVDILDQCAFGFYFFCKIQDSAGNISRSKKVHAVLDRNREQATHSFESHKVKETKKIDGILEQEWFEQQPIEMLNDDNTYHIYSCWDNDNLYLAVTVKDNKVYTRFKELTPSKHQWDSAWFNDSVINKIWTDDCIAFFFDANSNRTSLPELEDRMIYIAPTGVYLAYKIDIYKKILYNLKDIQCITNILIDKNTSAYIVELAIPWKTMGITPKENYKMGFEIYMVDRENASGPRVIACWSGKPYNHLNPSEWGSLILKQETTYFSETIIILIFFIIIAVVGVLFLRYRKTMPIDTSETYLTRDEHIVEKAENYIKENFTDQELNRNKVADYLAVSSSYLSKIYKKTTNKTLPHFKNKLRINKAKELLRDSDKNITEIAFEVGFGTTDHFIRIFKDFEGLTPNNYRKNHLKHK